MCLAGEGEGTEPGNSPQESFALHQNEPLITQQLLSIRNHMDCDFIYDLWINNLQPILKVKDDKLLLLHLFFNSCQGKMFIIRRGSLWLYAIFHVSSVRYNSRFSVFNYLQMQLKPTMSWIPVFLNNMSVLECDISCANKAPKRRRNQFGWNPQSDLRPSLSAAKFINHCQWNICSIPQWISNITPQELFSFNVPIVPCWQIQMYLNE